MSAVQLPDMVQAVWPEASAKEVAAAAQRLVSTGTAVEHLPAGILEHRLWPLLRELWDAAVELTDPLRFAKNRGAGWAEPLSRPLGSRRPGFTSLPQRHKPGGRAAEDRAERRRQRHVGPGPAEQRQPRAPLEAVYKEYQAFEDIKLAAAGEATIDENMVHAACVPKGSSIAFQAWQRALAEYKPQ